MWTRIAAGKRDQVIERRLVEGYAAARSQVTCQAAFGIVERAADDGPDLLVGQRLEPPDPHAREQRGIHLEVGVFGRRADEGDGPVLDVWQQGILLRLVESMDLVEEEDRPGPVQRQPLLRLRDRGPDLHHAGHHRREGDELGADGVGEQTREARLAGAGRSPQQHRGEVPARDAASERPTLADEVTLPDEFVEVPRAHPGGQRLAFGWWLEQGFGSRTRDAAGWHVRIVSPSRRARRGQGAGRRR